MENPKENIEPPKETSYYEAFVNALKKSWKYKFLWIWGIFLPGGFSFNMNFSSPSKEFKSESLPKGELENIIPFLEKNWILITIIIGFFVLLGIISWILSAIARAGIINFLNFSQEISEKNKKINAREEFKGIWTMGKKNLKKILKLDIFVFLASLALFFVTLAPIIFLFMSGKKGAIFLAIIGMIIFIPLAMLFFLIRKTGEIFIVLSNLKTFQAIEHGYYLIIKNLKELVKLLLGLLVFGFLSSFVISIIMIILAIIFIGFAALTTLSLGIKINQLFQGKFENFMQNLDGGQIAIILGLIFIFVATFIIIMLLSKSILGIARYDVWIWWVKKNQGVKNQEEEKEILVEKIKDEKTSTAIDFNRKN